MKSKAPLVWPHPAPTFQSGYFRVLPCCLCAPPDVDSGYYTVKFDSLLLKEAVVEGDSILPPLRTDPAGSSDSDGSDADDPNMLGMAATTQEAPGWQGPHCGQYKDTLPGRQWCVMDLGHVQRPTDIEAVVPRKPRGGDGIQEGTASCRARGPVSWMKDRLSVSSLPRGGVPTWGLLAALSALMEGRTALHKGTGSVEEVPSCDRVVKWLSSAFCLCHMPWAGCWGCWGLVVQS